MKDWEISEAHDRPRAFRVRPCFGGGQIQLSVISTRGNIMEAVTLPAHMAPALIELIQRAADVAERDLMNALARAKEKAAAERPLRRQRNRWVRSAAGRAGAGKEYVAFDRGAT